MTASEREALVARVREQLEHWDSSGFEHVTLAVPVGDLRALCAEVERLTGMGDAYRTTIADYDSRVGALQDEVERLTRERDAAVKSRMAWMAQCDKEILAHRDAMPEAMQEHLTIYVAASAALREMP